MNTPITAICFAILMTMIIWIPGSDPRILAVFAWIVAASSIMDHVKLRQVRKEYESQT